MTKSWLKIDEEMAVDQNTVSTDEKKIKLMPKKATNTREQDEKPNLDLDVSISIKFVEKPDNQRIKRIENGWKKKWLTTENTNEIWSPKQFGRWTSVEKENGSKDVK